MQSASPSLRAALIFTLIGVAAVSVFFYTHAGEPAFLSAKQQPMNSTTNNPPKPSAADLSTKLTPEQFRVTQEDGTEPPFRNAYWNNQEAGLYVDIVSGEPLFNSADKFDSGTGWPSFTKPVKSENVVEHTDSTFGMRRTEVRSKEGNCHLGHVFDDGPAPTGMRYCMNSAALRFIPVDKLESEGYGQFLPLFVKK